MPMTLSLRRNADREKSVWSRASPSSEARVRTSGSRPAHVRKKDGRDQLAAGGTLTYEEPLAMSRFREKARWRH
jgi:hypothetical protein